jgi:hypothetical protein
VFCLASYVHTLPKHWFMFDQPQNPKAVLI